MSRKEEEEKSGSRRMRKGDKQLFSFTTIG
jgi:hypothetical protein